MTDGVAVTGATGFVGRHLTDFLATQDGLAVHALSRHGGRVGETQVGAVDLSDARAVDRWCASVPRLSVVFHLAATVPTSLPDPPSALEGNVRTTLGAVSIAARYGAHLVYASSAFVYGATQGDILTETSVLRPTTYYHLSKVVGEQVCELAAERHELTATALRIAAAYGRGQTSSTVLRKFVAAARDSAELLVHGSGGRSQDFIHVSDVARALWLAGLARKRGAFNIASGHSVSMNDLATMVCAHVPGSGSQVRLSGKPDPQENARWVFSTEAARLALGFQASVSLAEGIRDLAGER